MRFAVAVATAMLAGCATHPRDIAPLYVAEAPYQHLTCDQMRDELLNVNTALVNASSRQIDARSNDALGVFLIGLPLASMTGKDATAQVAMLKGSADAIRRAGDAKSCGSLAPVISFDDVKAKRATATQP